MFEIRYVSGSYGRTMDAGNCGNLSIKCADRPAHLSTLSGYGGEHPCGIFVESQYSASEFVLKESFDFRIEQGAPAAWWQERYAIQQFRLRDHRYVKFARTGGAEPTHDVRCGKTPQDFKRERLYRGPSFKRRRLTVRFMIERG